MYYTYKLLESVTITSMNNISKRRWRWRTKKKFVLPVGEELNAGDFSASSNDVMVFSDGFDNNNIFSEMKI